MDRGTDIWWSSLFKILVYQAVSSGVNLPGYLLGFVCGVEPWG